jgi:adenylate cyclase
VGKFEAFLVHKNKIIQIILGLICLLLILISLDFPKLPVNVIFDDMDGFFYDTMLGMSMKEKPQSAHVVIIDVDDYSVQQEGSWPWTRDKLVTLINDLKEAGVVIIAFDVLFSNPEANYALRLKKKIQNTPQLLQNAASTQLLLLPILDSLAPKVDDDLAFANTLKNSEVALGFLFHQDAHIQIGKIPAPLSIQNFEQLPGSRLKLYNFKGYNGILPMFHEADPKAGFFSNVPDSDGVIRHGLMIGNFNDKTYASFSLSIVMRYLMADTVTYLPASIKKGRYHRGLDVSGVFIPIDKQGQILLPYFGLPHTIDTFSAADILNKKVPAAALSGSIAIVGSTMIALGDLHESPIAQNFPGVEMVANMVLGILSKQLSSEYKLDSGSGLKILVPVGAIYALLLPYLGPIAMAITYLVSVIVLFMLDFWLLAYFNIYVSVSHFLILLSAQSLIAFSYNFVLERRQKNKINNLFGQYLPPSHIQKLLTTPESIAIDGEARDMTVFFADIRSFTTISESLTAREVKKMLNVFFTPVTELIFKHKGTIDKYVGDMVIAFWGAPSIDKDHAFHGISAALDIQKNLADINLKLQSMELPALSIGMGLSTGIMDVGDMGSEFRRSYTVLGDAVNLGSRLQDLTKFYGVSILVSEATRDQQNAFFWYPIDKVMVKGRQNALMIYTPISLYEDATDAMKDELAAYEQALSVYQQQNWAEALTLFKQLIANFPAKKIYAIYASRSETFLTQPPEHWEGVFVFQDKKG